MRIEKIPAGKLSSADKWILGFCRLGFAGLSPVAPGTCGTALACCLAPFLFIPFSLTARICILLAVLLAGSLAATCAEKILMRKDPGEVVIDELLGLWIVLLPFERFNYIILIAAFVFFRFFDILKPWPIKLSEVKFPAGWGVMIDDAIAGIYALLCVLALNHFFAFYSW